jgi:hypothetical protein
MRDIIIIIWLVGEWFPRKKEYGGLGIPSLAEMNMCLLASWIKRYHLDNDKL